MELTVTKDMNDKLKALLCFAAKADARYYLNGVLIEVRSGEVRGVATNGHFIGVAKLGVAGGGADGEWILRREWVEGIVKRRDIYTLTLSDPALVASRGFSAKPIEGKFPDWRRVAQHPTGEQSVGYYNAEYLYAIAKASKCLGNKHGYFKLSQFGTSGAPFQISDDFCGVVMPMR